jgi:hypothetical protein
MSISHLPLARAAGAGTIEIATVPIRPGNPVAIERKSRSLR